MKNEVKDKKEERDHMPEENQIQEENSQEENDSQWVPEPSPQYDGISEINQVIDTEEPNIDNHSKESLTDQTAGEKAALTKPSEPVSPSEERTWAMLAHLSVLLNLITGFLGGIAAIIIYFAYKDRSRLVAYHAMQAFIFQAITWIGAGLFAGVFISFGAAFAILIIPLLCLVPGFLFLLLIPISLIYGVVGGIQVNNGEDFRYWQVGDWVRDILDPKPIP